jgi:hypothetical protein
MHIGWLAAPDTCSNVRSRNLGLLDHLVGAQHSWVRPPENADDIVCDALVERREAGTVSN